jgi:MFS family permease
MMADSIEHVISYWIIFEKFQSPSLAGFAVISHWLPFLLFSSVAGGLADRFDPRRVIQVGMVLFMIASLGWSLLFWTDTLEMWHAVVLLVIHGLAGVLWSPAAQMLIHDIVGPAELQSGVRLTATARTLGLLMGPAIGGGLMLLVGAPEGLLINAAIYLPLTLWLSKAPYGWKFRNEIRTHTTNIGQGITAFFDTVRHIVADQRLLTLTLLAGLVSLLVGNAYQAQMPEFAYDLGARDGGVLYSALFAANAVGALTAGLVLESRRLLPARPRAVYVLVIVWCVVIVAFAASRNAALSLALLFVAGFLELSFNTMAQTLVQLNAPAAIRGKVIGVYFMSFLGLKSFSGVFIGIGGGIVGIHWSLGASAVLLLFCVLALWSVMHRRRLAAAAGE